MLLWPAVNSDVNGMSRLSCDTGLPGQGFNGKEGLEEEGSLEWSFQPARY